MLENLFSTVLGSAATNEAYALYGQKLALLQELDLLKPPILYPVGGIDYFPAVHGETIYLDSNPDIYPYTYLRCLKRNFPKLPLPADTSTIRSLCRDLRRPSEWDLPAEDVSTLLLKGVARVLDFLVNSEDASLIVQALTYHVAQGGICLLFDQDIRWADLLRNLGWSPVTFPSSAGSLLARPSGGVIEFVGVDFDYMMGLRSGGIVQAFRKPLDSTTAGME